MAMQIKVQDFVRGRQMNRERVTARQVLDFLVQQKHLVVPIDGEGRYQKVPFKAAYRNVQRWLADFAGYDRGKRKGNLIRSSQNVAKKHHYLRTFFANGAKPPGERLREVYTPDESYIHEHYHRNEDSLFDPDDDEDVIYQKEKHKGGGTASAPQYKDPIH
jgi:hypothetical protein